MSAPKAPAKGPSDSGGGTDLTRQSELFDTDELLAIVRANRAEVERTQARPYPIGLYCIVVGRIDPDSPLSLHEAGQVVGYHAEVGDGELWLRNAWGEITRVRLHDHDDNDPLADTVGPATFYETWEAFEIALEQQFKFERAQYARTKR